MLSPINRFRPSTFYLHTSHIFTCYLHNNYNTTTTYLSSTSIANPISIYCTTKSNPAFHIMYEQKFFHLSARPVHSQSSITPEREGGNNINNNTKNVFCITERAGEAGVGIPQGLLEQHHFSCYHSCVSFCITGAGKTGKGEIAFDGIATSHAIGVFFGGGWFSAASKRLRGFGQRVEVNFSLLVVVYQ